MPVSVCIFIASPSIFHAKVYMVPYDLKGRRGGRRGRDGRKIRHSFTTTPAALVVLVNLHAAVGIQTCHHDARENRLPAVYGSSGGV